MRESVELVAAQNQPPDLYASEFHLRNLAGWRDYRPSDARASGTAHRAQREHCTRLQEFPTVLRHIESLRFREDTG